jgi:prefoldin subunit 5
MISRSPEELSRELQVLAGKIRTLTSAQRRIEREAEQLAEAIGALSGQPQKPVTYSAH